MAVRAGSTGPTQTRLISGSQLREGQGFAHMGIRSQGRGERSLMGPDTRCPGPGWFVGSVLFFQILRESLFRKLQR